MQTVGVPRLVWGWDLLYLARRKTSLLGATPPSRVTIRSFNLIFSASCFLLLNQTFVIFFSYTPVIALTGCGLLILTLVMWRCALRSFVPYLSPNIPAGFTVAEQAAATRRQVLLLKKAWTGLVRKEYPRCLLFFNQNTGSVHCKLELRT